MAAIRYIFVNDQGRVFTSCGEPTRGDFDSAEVGMVTILRLSDNHYYGRERKWCAVPAGVIVTADMEDGEVSPPFHIPADQLASIG